MTRFAILAPPFPSHVSALSALAGALIAQGHTVYWMHQADVAGLLKDSRIRFVALGQQTHPRGSLAQTLARAARPRSPWGLRRVIQDMSAATRMLVREGAPALRAHHIDVVIADQMEAAGGLLAAALGLPWVSVACALPINREDGLPLPVMPWPLPRTEQEMHRARISARIYDWMMASHANTLRALSTELGIAPRASLEACLSPTLQLSQTTEGFDFARHAAPSNLHHVGPLRQLAVRASAQATGAQGAGQAPFIYTSLGTLQGARFALFMRIAKACKAVGARLLVAHCGGLDARQERALLAAGAQQVVHTADQIEVLRHARLMVTHAGLNSAMECLAAGVPMLAIPLAFDQPGVAARIAHAGAGLRLAPHRASVAAITEALRELLADDRFREAAQRLGQEVLGSGGAAQAARLIERALELAPAPGAMEAERVAA